MQNTVTIEIKGHIDQKWKNWFNQFEISYDGGNTLLKGEVCDDSQLYGIINKLRDLNLSLLSLSTLSNSTEAP